MIVHTFRLDDSITPDPGVFALIVVPFSVYPAPFVITSTPITLPFATRANSFAPTPSPSTIMSGTLK